MNRILLLTFALALASVRGNHCDNLGTLFYDELGCTPTLGNDGCPISYDCPDFTPPSGTCRFGGKIYQNGEQINGTDVCKIVVCYSPEIAQGIIDCFQRPDEGCYFANTFDKCCRTEQICAPFDDVATCEVDGEIYKEGEAFSPRGHCLECICQKNFTGEFVEPFCKRKICGIEITENPLFEKSAPVYLNNPTRCCSDIMKPSHANILNTISSGNNTDEKCRFGSNEYNLGDILIAEYTNPNYYNGPKHSVICNCNLPPFLTCTQI